MSLPTAWVDKLFTKLIVTYGQRFLGLYAGVDLQIVKDDWAEELAGYVNNPDAIKHALQHLPTDRPPNVLEFKQLCRGAPAKAPLMALEAPKSDPARVAEAMASMTAPKPKYNPREWAENLKALEERGGRLTMAQKMMWREALKE